MIMLSHNESWKRGVLYVRNGIARQLHIFQPKIGNWDRTGCLRGYYRFREGFTFTSRRISP